MTVTVTQKIGKVVAAASDTTSITVDVGTNVGLVAMIMTLNDVESPYITFNGHPFILMNRSTNGALGSDLDLSLFYLPNAPAGTANLATTSEIGYDLFVVQITEGKAVLPLAGVGSGTGTNTATGPDADIGITDAGIIFNFTITNASGAISANSGWTIGNAGSSLNDGSLYLSYAYREYTASTTSTGAEVLYSGASGSTDWAVLTTGIKTSKTSQFSKDMRVATNRHGKAKRLKFNG